MDEKFIYDPEDEIKVETSSALHEMYLKAMDAYDNGLTKRIMTKAEEAALKAYPVEMTPLNYQDLIEQFGGKTEIDVNTYPRCLFQHGYEQANQDIIAIIQSRIDEILGDAQPAPILRMELNELIKKIEGQ